MDLAESHDPQKYGYIFLYMSVHTRNYIEENSGYINKGWQPLCQNISDARNISYSVIRRHQVYIIYYWKGITVYMYQE